MSAYEVAIGNGFVGTITDWLLSLKGDDGADGGAGGIGSAVTSGVVGGVLYVDASGNLAQDTTKFFYDATNDRIGIGTNSPSAHLHAKAVASTNVGVIVQGAASQSVDLFQAMDSAGVIRARVTSAREFSNHYGQTGTEVYGAGAIASMVGGTLNTVVGSAAEAAWSYQVVIGKSAKAWSDCYGGVAIGGAASARGGNYSVAIGFQADTFLNGQSVCIGWGATGAYNIGGASISIGAQAAFTAPNQLVAGSGSYPVNNVHFGKGVVHATPTAYTLNGTGGSGTNIAGANLNVAAGKATGNAVPGCVKLQTSVLGSSGSTLQTLVDRLILDGAGVVFIANATTVPTTNPVGGGYLYFEGGALKCRGSSGTITTLAPA